MAGPVDQWSQGAQYEVFMGRWSRRAADGFVTWAAADPGLRWLDVGSGTGALAATILQLARPAAVAGVDTSAGYVAEAGRRITDPRAHFEIGDAHEPAGDESFDVAVSGLMLNFAGDPGAVVDAMRRAVTPGGLVAAYVWDYRRMDLLGHFWAAAVALDAGAHAMDEAVRFAPWSADHLSVLWHTAGLRDVRTHAIDITCELRDFDDYWQPFEGGQGPAAAYLHSLGERARTDLRDAVRARLPPVADGPLLLRATAWAVKGTRGTRAGLRS